MLWEAKGQFSIQSSAQKAQRSSPSLEKEQSAKPDGTVTNGYFSEHTVDLQDHLALAKVS